MSWTSWSASICFSCSIHWAWSSCIFCQSVSHTVTVTFNFVGASSITWSMCLSIVSTLSLMVFTAAPSAPSSRWVWRIEDSKDSLALMTAESKTEEKDVMVKVVVNLINQQN